MINRVTPLRIPVDHFDSLSAVDLSKLSSATFACYIFWESFSFATNMSILTRRLIAAAVRGRQMAYSASNNPHNIHPGYFKFKETQKAFQVDNGLRVWWNWLWNNLGDSNVFSFSDPPASRHPGQDYVRHHPGFGCGGQRWLRLVPLLGDVPAQAAVMARKDASSYP